ncbi:MAG TPA: hypothetical protein IGS52_00045 [Oscillatoriaceae cyanobacterium M33_DOE_052]|uniref:Uncharacterized protein n=1 Tax=Planktothricoides sp. SpSt-374 TaxID=2282167 RepID=A0A7C3VHF1_9CYAN|nr:hypothetical protein [Oscillatoriaceae cyanobacterium M33_DOE_052]
MIIRDLEQLEVVSEETQVEGGYGNAFANAGALSSAYGWNSFTNTSASTITQTTDYSSFSGSGSSSAAASNSYYYYGYYPYYY